MIGLLLVLAQVFAPTSPADYPGDSRSCGVATVTGYNRHAGNAFTYDGTPITTDEPIVAASWSIPIDTVVEIDGLGTFRVADRGRLGPSHFDVAVWSDAEAYAITGTYAYCVQAP